MGAPVKILLISASPHRLKSNTFLLAEAARQACAAAGAETEVVHLPDLEIKFCLHCEACHREILACPLKDGVRPLLDKMLEADGLILATPNYINQVTASMKALFDRSSHFIHCLRLSGKYVSGVVSSGSGRDKEVLDYLAHYAHTCGAWYSGGLSASVAAVPESRARAVEIGNRLVADIKEKRGFPGQDKIINEHRSHFKRLIEARKDDWPGEYRYWQEQGWL
ncbi:MAG: 2-amino-4-deoxychorismate dehydrogenase [candidate division TA06 bacterium ADurb.Bin417]|uniref:2-amino-4-deoxychorismate dehydrogenase n=1 Tax=candidate division TA06 bacterium ADurb.Bin417 TaxID=1852828 RepID=A0A1V5MFS2_UNCT6|nr:MAG: 2-amino-4-deoxychorismate dehydrogenase [candidate division TA06 bacterium ADurb.Bin417]